MRPIMFSIMSIIMLSQASALEQSRTDEGKTDQWFRKNVGLWEQTYGRPVHVEPVMATADGKPLLLRYVFPAENACYRQIKAQFDGMVMWVGVLDCSKRETH